MHTVITKFLSPTNTRGSRIKATYWGGSVTVPYDHSLSNREVHLVAVEALLRKHRSAAGIDLRVVAGGELPNGTGYAFIIN